MEKPFLIDILTGADPELFVKNIQTGAFVPSLDLIGGTKLDPRPTSQKGFFVQEDNILVEYNIPPSKNKLEFRENILLGMKLFEEFLPADKYALEIKTSHKFKAEDLKDPRANEFGCTPDQNAWLNGEYNRAPAVPKDGLRCAGGHIHVGYKIDKTHPFVKDSPLSKQDINIHIVRWMDLLMGVPSMKLDKDLDRRKLYGKAGAYRDKPYGLEYRTLSSFWLSSKELIDWAFDKTQLAVEKVNNLELIPQKIHELVQVAINRNNTKAIDRLVSEYQLELV